MKKQFQYLQELVKFVANNFKLTYKLTTATENARERFSYPSQRQRE